MKDTPIEWKKELWRDIFGRHSKLWNYSKQETFERTTKFFDHQLTTIFQEMEGVIGKDDLNGDTALGWTELTPEQFAQNKLKQEQRSRLAELKKRWVKNG